MSTTVDKDPLEPEWIGVANWRHREVSELLGVRLLAVERIPADPGVRNVRRSHPAYRPPTPLRWYLSLVLPADHPNRRWLPAGSAGLVGVTVDNAALRNPRRLADFRAGYGERPEILPSAEDGRRLVKALHETYERGRSA